MADSSAAGGSKSKAKSGSDAKGEAKEAGGQGPDSQTYINESKFDEARLNKTGWLYEAPPVVEKKAPRPEDCIPDLPENQKAREFLARAPTKGLWQPLGIEVKVMQCWRCKAYGHRTGDKDCPLFLSGNAKIEEFLKTAGDPMAGYVSSDKVKEAVDERKKQLQALLDAEEREEKERKAKKKEKKRAKKEEKKRRKEEKKRRKKEKEKEKEKEGKKKKKDKSSSSSSSSSDSDSDSGSDRDRKRSKKGKDRD